MYRFTTVIATQMRLKHILSLLKYVCQVSSRLVNLHVVALYSEHNAMFAIWAKNIFNYIILQLPIIIFHFFNFKTCIVV